MRWLLVGQDIVLFIFPAMLIALIVCRHYNQRVGGSLLRGAFDWLGLQSRRQCSQSPQPSSAASPTPAILQRDVPLSVWGMAILLMLLAQPGINLLAYLNEMIHLPEALAGMEAWMQQMESANAATTEQLMATKTIGGFLANIAVIGLLAAISEEMLFRGAIQGVFALPSLRSRNLCSSRSGSSGVSAANAVRPGVAAAIWAAAILFSAMHLQFYGFIPRMLMGALFGYMLVWSGTLWLPILMHATNNTMVVIAYAIWPQDKTISSTIETFGTADTWYVGVISLVLVGGLIYQIRKSLLSSQA